MIRNGNGVPGNRAHNSDLADLELRVILCCCQIPAWKAWRDLTRLDETRRGRQGTAIPLSMT